MTTDSPTPSVLANGRHAISCRDSHWDASTGKPVEQILAAMALCKSGSAAASYLGVSMALGGHIETLVKMYIYDQFLLGGDLDKMAVTYGINQETMREYRRNRDAN